MTQAMSFSPFKKAHAERLEAWNIKLNQMSEILEQWLNCQRNWMYIFLFFFRFCSFFLFLACALSLFL